MSEKVATNFPFHILWKSRIWRQGSSAIISRELVLAFAQLGISVWLYNLDPATTTCPLLEDPHRQAHLQNMDRNSIPSPPFVAIRCASAEPGETQLIEGIWDITPNAHANIAYLTLPYGYLPAGALPQTANRLLRQIWACSQYVANTLVEGGFDANRVRSIPLGYAPDIFHPGVPPAHIATHKQFRFIHVSIPYLVYKGIDVLLRAYIEEFDQQDDTCLILQCRPRSGMEEAIMEVLEAEKARTRHQPEVLFLPLGVSQHTLASWFTAASCYVQTSRCEGFGMPVLEAMACGLPVIATNWGGHLEMCDETTGYLIDCTLTGPPEGAKKEGLESIPVWAEPDVAHLRYRMRYAYEHSDEALHRGKVAAHTARQQFTWEHAGKKAIAVMREGL